MISFTENKFTGQKEKSLNFYELKFKLLNENGCLKNNVRLEILDCRLGLCLVCSSEECGDQI